MSSNNTSKQTNTEYLFLMGKENYATPQNVDYSFEYINYNGIGTSYSKFKKKNITLKIAYTIVILYAIWFIIGNLI